MWLLTLIGRKWLIGAAVAAFVAYSGWLSYKVHTVTYRNLTNYYENKIAQNRLAMKEARLKAEAEHAEQIRAWADYISSIDIPDTDAALERLCKLSPDCQTGSSGS